MSLCRLDLKVMLDKKMTPKIQTFVKNHIFRYIILINFQLFSFSLDFWGHFFLDASLFINNPIK